MSLRFRVDGRVPVAPEGLTRRQGAGHAFGRESRPKIRHQCRTSTAGRGTTHSKENHTQDTSPSQVSGPTKRSKKRKRKQITSPTVLPPQLSSTTTHNCPNRLRAISSHTCEIAKCVVRTPILLGGRHFQAATSKFRKFHVSMLCMSIKEKKLRSLDSVPSSVCARPTDDAGDSRGCRRTLQ